MPSELRQLDPHSGNLRENRPAGKYSPELSGEAQKRRARFALRDSLLHIAGHKRQRACGRFPSRLEGVTLSRYPLPHPDPEIETPAEVEAGPAWRAKVGGARMCELLWTCPVCGPRIRQERAAELEEACHRWSARRGLGSVLFLTLTLPHDYGEELADVLGDVKAAWSRTISGRGWHQDKQRFGLRHYVRSHDVTVGAAGWHPHLHAVLFAEAPVSDADAITLRGRLLERWQAAIVARGRRPPSAAHGIRLEAVRNIGDIAAYVLQVAGNGKETRRNVALELARGDLKSSRHAGQRTPWEVLADYTAAPNRRDLALWREWETATRGVHAIQWSRGLRAAVQLTPGPAPAPELEPGEEVVWKFPGNDWLGISHRAGRIAAILEAAEEAGTVGVAYQLQEWKRAAGGQVDRQRAREEIRAHILPQMQLAGAAAEAADRAAGPGPNMHQIAHIARWRRILEAVDAGTKPAKLVPHENTPARYLSREAQ